MLEEDVYPYLEAQGIPSNQWEYYIAFARRMWERRVHFNHETFTIEKELLVSEFTARGLNPTHLAAIQGYAEDKAEIKLVGMPKVEAYPGVTVLADTDDMGQWPGVTVTEGEVMGLGQWPGVTVLADTDDMGQWAGVTVEQGTVT